MLVKLGGVGLWLAPLGGGRDAANNEIFSPYVRRAKVEKLLPDYPEPRAFIQREGSRHQKGFLTSLPGLSFPKALLLTELPLSPASALGVLSSHV